MTPLLEGDRLILHASFVECAALWTHDEPVFLNVWQPLALEVYINRWARQPGDLLLAGHLDFRDPAGRSWIQVVDWSHPPHPQCTHPERLAQWEQALERQMLSWWASLDHPCFAWIHAHNPTLLR